MTKFALFLVAVTATAQGPSTSGGSYLQTSSRLLAREFPSKDLSYILLDLRIGESIESGWQSSKRAIPAGSLVKPFTAIAYADSHNFRYPERTCAGGNACWKPAGHGKLDIVHAIAVSCNSYFFQLAREVSAIDAAKVARSFGLSGPDVATSPEGLTGRYGQWRESPQALIHAYAELLGRASQPGVREIVDGMAQSAKSGTAEAASKAVPALALLAKTGTAPCTHAKHAPGDGFVVVAWPAETPHYILLVRLHSAPGAQAAALAGKMVRTLESQP